MSSRAGKNHLTNLGISLLPCELKFRESCGHRDDFSAGIIRQADSPSHFHLPPSAHIPLTRESFLPTPLPPLPVLIQAEDTCKVTGFQRKALALMHISSGRCKQSRQEGEGVRGIWRQGQGGVGMGVLKTATHEGKRERNDFTPQLQFAS